MPLEQTRAADHARGRGLHHHTAVHAEQRDDSRASGQFTNQSRLRSFIRYLDRSVAVTCVTFSPSSAARICRAAGPATEPPCPPCSTTTATQYFGLLCRREADEPREVVLAVHLGGAGLARNGDGERSEHALRRTGLGDHDQRALHGGEVARGGLRRERDLRLRLDDRLSIGTEHLLENVRLHDVAAVRDACVCVDELERGHEQVALTDGEVHGVAGQPPLHLGVVLVVARLPLRVRHAPGCLTRQVDAAVGAEPERSRELLELLAAQSCRTCSRRCRSTRRTSRGWRLRSSQRRDRRDSSTTSATACPCRSSGPGR